MTDTTKAREALAMMYSALKAADYMHDPLPGAYAQLRAYLDELDAARARIAELENPKKQGVTTTELRIDWRTEYLTCLRDRDAQYLKQDARIAELEALNAELMREQNDQEEAADDPTNDELSSRVAELDHLLAKGGPGVPADDDLGRIVGPARCVDQTSFHVEGVSNGNCTEAAVATLLGLRLDEVPEFPRENPAVHWDAIDAFFASRGLELVSMAPDDTLFGGLHLASGLSARGVHHMVVMQNGAVVHDPHPSRAGLLDVRRVYIVVPRDPRVLAGVRAVQVRLGGGA